MADEALERRAGELGGVPVEGQVGGFGLDAVVELGGSAVVVNVLDGRGRNAALGDGEAHGPGGFLAALLEPDAVKGLASRAVARDFAVNLGAAGAGTLEFLEHEEPGAFGDHEPVAIAGEGARGALGLGVPACAHDAHEHEAAQDQRRDGRVDAAGDHHVDHAGANVAVGVADGVGRGGAAGGEDVAEAAEAEAHRDFAGQRADGAGGDHVHAALPFLAGVIEAVLLLGKFLAASAGAQDDADLAELVARHAGGLDAGVGESFLHGGDSERRGAGDVRAVLGRDVILLAEAGHFSGHLDGIAGRVETGNAADAATPVAGGFPEGLPANTIRTHGPDARDHHATIHQYSGSLDSASANRRMC